MNLFYRTAPIDQGEVVGKFFGQGEKALSNPALEVETAALHAIVLVKAGVGVLRIEIHQESPSTESNVKVCVTACESRVFLKKCDCAYLTWSLSVGPCKRYREDEQ